MKISQYIADLQKIQTEHGNISLACQYEDGYGDIRHQETDPCYQVTKTRDGGTTILVIEWNYDPRV